jgi:hypothetical protein
MIRQGRETARKMAEKEPSVFSGTGGFCLLDFRLQENVFADEQCSQDVHERRDLVASIPRRIEPFTFLM